MTVGTVITLEISLYLKNLNTYIHVSVFICTAKQLQAPRTCTAIDLARNKNLVDIFSH